MKQVITIEYNLTIPDSLELDDDDKDGIIEEATLHINEMQRQGYICGELCVLLTKNDEDHELRGWFKIDDLINWGE